MNHKENQKIKKKIIITNIKKKRDSEKEFPFCKNGVRGRTKSQIGEYKYREEATAKEAPARRKIATKEN